MGTDALCCGCRRAQSRGAAAVRSGRAGGQRLRRFFGRGCSHPRLSPSRLSQPCPLVRRCRCWRLPPRRVLQWVRSGQVRSVEPQQRGRTRPTQSTHALECPPFPPCCPMFLHAKFHLQASSSNNYALRASGGGPPPFLLLEVPMCRDHAHTRIPSGLVPADTCGPLGRPRAAAMGSTCVLNGCGRALSPRGRV